MRPSIYWLDLPGSWRLAIMPRPRAGDWLEDEIAGWRDEGVDIAVSLLEDHEVAELRLADEPRLCAANGIGFVSFPIPDREVPASRAAAERLALELIEALDAGRAVAIHCRAGIGRSSLLAASVLVLGYPEKQGADAAFAIIATARGTAVPDTEAQRQWVAAWSAEL